MQIIADGSTHFSVVAPEGMAVCLRPADSWEVCEDCGATPATADGGLWQPLGMEGGSGACCASCMQDWDWSVPAPLPIPDGVHTHL